MSIYLKCNPVLCSALQSLFEKEEMTCLDSLEEKPACVITESPSAEEISEIHQTSPLSLLIVLSTGSETSKLPPYAFPLEQPFRLHAFKALYNRLLEDIAENTFPVGSYRIHKKERFGICKETGATPTLTEKEVSILWHLHTAEGAVVTREDLLEKIWQYNQDINTHTLETHIYKLRKKLFLQKGVEVLITSDSGYRLEN